MLFSASETNLFPFTSPPCMGCESSVERLLSLFYLSIHPSLPPLLLAPLLSSLSLFPLAEQFSSPSIILAHKTWGGGLAGCVFRAGYTAMGALTRTNAIHASHLLARSYEKGWPRLPLWDIRQRTIIHQAAEHRGVAEFRFIPIAVSCLRSDSTVFKHGRIIWKKQIFGKS